jgi:hypothetical protein
MLAGASSAAIDWVGALLLGYVPERIPITLHAFDQFRWPLTDFPADDIRVCGAFGNGTAELLEDAPLAERASAYPLGWLDAVKSSVHASTVTPAADGEPA